MRQALLLSSSFIQTIHQSRAQGRLAAGAAAGGLSGGRGFGPRLGRVPRRRQTANGGLPNGDRRRRQAAAGQPVIVCGQQEQQPTLVAQSGADESGDTTQAAPNVPRDAMQQPLSKQSAPGSRSDTLLQSAAAEGINGRSGGRGGGGGEASNGLGRPSTAGAAEGGNVPAPGVGGQPGSAAASTSNSVPVYVMLPLDTVNAEGVFRYASSKWFSAALQRLAASGIRGVAVDVWVSALPVTVRPIFGAALPVCCLFCLSVFVCLLLLVWEKGRQGCGMAAASQGRQQFACVALCSTHCVCLEVSCPTLCLPHSVMPALGQPASLRRQPAAVVLHSCAASVHACALHDTPAALPCASPTVQPHSPSAAPQTWPTH
jgi:hypothetical protein